MAMAFVWILVVATVFLGDMWIKKRMEKYLHAAGEERKEKPLLGGRLLLRRHHNRGIMLNLGENHRKAVAAISLIMTAVLTIVFILSLGRRGGPALRAGLALVLGGAFSNTYDRLKRGYVVDYVSFHVKWKPLGRLVFNIADFCIIIGALLAVLGVEGAD